MNINFSDKKVVCINGAEYQQLRKNLWINFDEMSQKHKKIVNSIIPNNSTLNCNNVCYFRFLFLFLCVQAKGIHVVQSVIHTLLDALWFWFFYSPFTMQIKLNRFFDQFSTVVHYQIYQWVLQRQCIRKLMRLLLRLLGVVAVPHEQLITICGHTNKLPPLYSWSLTLAI